VKLRLAGLLPLSWRRRLVRATRWPPVGRTDMGALRRLAPVSREWGAERGKPIDRHYIERFLGRHREDVAGRVLEVGTDMYTRTYGGDRVERSDVLHVAEQRPGVTLVADLTRGDDLPADAFDCVILTQTLQFVYDVPAALRGVHHTLKPGGILLATVPGISQISRHDMDRWGDFWRFTTLSFRRQLEAAFPGGQVDVAAAGNVLSAVAFLHGLAAEELSAEELAHEDDDYQLLISARARKAGGTG
jgi:SAM-dependent methyltransferase